MNEILDRLEFVYKDDGTVYVGAIFDVVDDTGKRRFALEPRDLELDDKALDAALVAKVKEYQADKVKAQADEIADLKAKFEAQVTEIAELKAANEKLIAIVEAL